MKVGRKRVASVPTAVILCSVLIGLGVWASYLKAGVDGESVLWHLVVLGIYWTAALVLAIVVTRLRRRKREPHHRPTREA